MKHPKFDEEELAQFKLKMLLLDLIHTGPSDHVFTTTHCYKCDTMRIFLNPSNIAIYINNVKSWFDFYTLAAAMEFIEENL
jgi:hypothetical protein